MLCEFGKIAGERTFCRMRTEVDAGMLEEGKSKKRRGRPRRDGSKSDNQREEITTAALELFSKQGYANTTLSGIARAAGLDQSSVYYWFSGKDDILRYLVEENRLSLIVAKGIGLFPENKPAQLFTVLHEDVIMLCQLPFDFYILEEAARSQPDSFGEFLDDYRDLRQRVADIIEAGVKDGSFVSCDAEAEAGLALAMNEGVQHRFHLLDLAEMGSRKPKADQVAHACASATVARLLAEGDVADACSYARERGWISC